MPVRSFSLIEILIVVAVLLFLVILTVPFGINFYQTQQLDATSDEVVQALRRAQLKAMSAEADSSFGVYLGSGQVGRYSLFRGASYATKTDEEIFDCADIISFNGASEVVFAKLTGVLLIPSTATIILSVGNNSRTITINTAGRINLE